MAYLRIIGCCCRPEDEERFNRWYDEVHVPMLMKFRGVKKASRYRSTDDNDKSPRYLAVYEFDSKEDLDAFANSPEAAAARDERKISWPNPDSGQVTWAARYEEIKSL